MPCIIKGKQHVCLDNKLEREMRNVMIKLLAILTVLAALPVSALAGQVSETNPSAKKCGRDAPDTYAQVQVAAQGIKAAADASVAK